MLSLYKIGASIPTPGNIRGASASVTCFILPRSPQSAPSKAFWAFRWPAVAIRGPPSDLALCSSPRGMRQGGKERVIAGWRNRIRRKKVSRSLRADDLLHWKSGAWWAGSGQRVVPWNRKALHLRRIVPGSREHLVASRGPFRLSPSPTPRGSTPVVFWSESLQRPWHWCFRVLRAMWLTV